MGKGSVEDILNIMNILVTGLGHEVLAMNSLELFQDKVREFMPDLLILDYWVANVTIIPIIKALKCDEELKKIPIILVTAVSTEKMKATEDIDEYISKPFDITYFRETVSRYL